MSQQCDAFTHAGIGAMQEIIAFVTVAHTQSWGSYSNVQNTTRFKIRKKN